MKHPIQADPRYAEVKDLVAKGRYVEAQDLENEIARDVREAPPQSG